MTSGELERARRWALLRISKVERGALKASVSKFAWLMLK